MEEESRPASWIAAALPIGAVRAAYVERPTVVWLDRRKQARHRCDSLSIAAKPIAGGHETCLQAYLRPHSADAIKLRRDRKYDDRQDFQGCPPVEPSSYRS
jgi:hypothetical protein